MKKLIHALTMYYILIKFTDFWRGVYRALDPAFQTAIINKTEELLLGGPEEAAKKRAKRSGVNYNSRWTPMPEAIILGTRMEASEVIDKLVELLKTYKSVTVAELHELVGLQSSFADSKWGWTALPEVKVTRIKQGYRLDLPEPAPLS